MGVALAHITINSISASLAIVAALLFSAHTFVEVANPNKEPIKTERNSGAKCKQIDEALVAAGS